MPFLRPEPIEKAILRIQGGETSGFQTAYKERGLLWSQTGKRIGDSNTNTIYYSACPAIWAYPVMELGDQDKMTVQSLLPVQRSPEFLDVGYESDLKIVQLWSSFLRNSHES